MPALSPHSSGSGAPTQEPPATGPLSQALRALPRVTGAAVAVWGMTQHPHGMMLWGLLILFLASSPPQPLRWVRWVRSGVDERQAFVEECSQPGSMKVEVTDVGARPVAVIKAVREVSGLPLGEAKKYVDSLPGPFLDGVSQASADRVQTHLEAAGARVRVH